MKILLIVGENKRDIFDFCKGNFYIFILYFIIDLEKRIYGIYLLSLFFVYLGFCCML